MKPARVIIILTLAAFTVLSCRKEEQQPDIPYVYVNFSLDPNSIQYQNLDHPGGWEYLTGGYKGILVYRISLYEFAAFERACPYDPTTTGARIEVDTTMITCYCPVCGSKYIMTDGSPFSGPTHWPLKTYQTYYDGVLLFVTN